VKKREKIVVDDPSSVGRRNCKRAHNLKKRPLRKKMKSLGILVDAEDKTIFSFDPVYGKRLRNNLILEDELQDDEEDTPLVDYSSD